MASKTRTIKVEHLARVEGTGAMYVKVTGDRVVDVRLEIFEPPRFFEALLRGRSLEEAPDITARICGICPVAYQMSAVHAMEDALGIAITPPIRALRRLLYCGEWIESHALHVFMLHAPDFLGYDDAIRMAKDHPEIVQRGLEIKKTGNEIVRVLAGREVHPINVRVGGFYRAPSRRELQPLIEPLKRGRDAARETVRWCATLPMPDVERDDEFVALSHPEEYPFNEGRIVSTQGLDITASEYDDHFEEEQVPHSNALHARLAARGRYHVGPMARYNLNFDRLAPVAREAAQEAGLGRLCRNTFQSIIVRSVEILHAFDEALRILEAYEPPERPFVEGRPRAAVGSAATEAPRGLLYHRYRIDENGAILDAKIVPPTSQNQSTIEDNLRGEVERNLHLSQEDLTWRCEQTIRNYDPCISCATHFLKLEIERT
jgi:coenzyme F420-reducing hydrogenase alpha subunit